MSGLRSDLERLSGHTLAELEALSAGDWHEPKPPARDWMKLALVVGLGLLSWVATYVGMLELIQANMGELSIPNKLVIAFSVAMLMTMIVWLLDQLFAPLPFATKLAYLAGYVFLTTISVGFGFGFYWKVLESRSEATRSAESAVTQVQGSLVAASARLEQLQGTLDDLTALSTRKAGEERDRGTSCPDSRPGDGPRRKLRDDDAARFGFASSFVKGRVDQVRADLKGLDADFAKISAGDPSTIDPTDGTRNAFMRTLERKLEMTSARFNAFRTDPQLRQIRTDLDARSTQTLFPTGKGDATFSCPDPQLQTALRGVVRAIDQLPILAKPEIATVEGSEAVIEAFRRLSATFYGALSFQLPPSADEMRELQKQAVRQAESNGGQPVVASGPQGGLTDRDWIPLAIAGFVDLCLLLVSIGRPMNRLDNLVPKMRSAEQGPVYRILSKFSEIHKDPDVRDKFELFRHVVFDFNGDYYVAVPLDAPASANPTERLALQQEAHLLANLFASFEKEKIFSRVINPLLGSKAVNKKLFRQGSKFAVDPRRGGGRLPEFRLYRFRDGAWSEIILGAVMGAAKRAELERRRKLLMEGPQLETPTQAPAEPAQQPAPRTVEPQRPAASADYDYRTAATPVFTGFQHRREAVFDPQHATAHTRAFGPYGTSAAQELSAFGPAPVGDPATIGDRIRRAHPRPIVEEEAEIEVRHTAGSGPSQPLEEPAADNVILMPNRPTPNRPLPNGPMQNGPMQNGPMQNGPMQNGKSAAVPRLADMTVERQLAAEPASASAMAPKMETAAQHATAELVERTMRLTVPVTEATLPAALIRKLRSTQRAEAFSTAAIDGSELAVEAVETGDNHIAALPAPDDSAELSTLIAAAASDGPAADALDMTDVEDLDATLDGFEEIDADSFDEDAGTLSAIASRFKPGTVRP